MTPKEATITIENAIKEKAGNLEALELALSILNDTYQPDLTSLELSQAEADRLSAELNAKAEALRVEKAEKESQIARAEVAETKVAEREEAVAILSEEKVKLEKDVADLTLSKKTATDALANVVNVISDALVKVTPAVDVIEEPIP